MKKQIWMTLAMTLLVLATMVRADAPKPATELSSDKAAAAETPFHGTPLDSLSGYLGNWEINTTWTNGTPIWSRSEFTAGIGGNFLVARTFTKNEKSELYERYLTIFAHDKETGTFKSHGFTYDGTVAVVDPVEVAGEKGHESISSRWVVSDSEIKQSVQLTSPTTYTWKVWVREVGAEEWNLIMDGVWKKAD